VRRADNIAPSVSQLSIQRGFINISQSNGPSSPIAGIVLPFTSHMLHPKLKKETKLSGLSPRANYTDRATTAVSEVSANFCG
jgi:hypothetical protein